LLRVTAHTVASAAAQTPGIGAHRAQDGIPMRRQRRRSRRGRLLRCRIGMRRWLLTM
jgi:hypothetical protein